MGLWLRSGGGGQGISLSCGRALACGAVTKVRGAFNLVVGGAQTCGAVTKVGGI